MNKKEKKEEVKEKKKPGRKGNHLKPMAPVIIPEEVMEKQTKEVQELLKKLNGLKERSSSERAKIRRALRKAGFKLSDFRK